MPSITLSEIQIDALSEVGNIGAGNATTALAKMTDQYLRLQVPQTQLVPFEQLPLVASTDLEEPLVSAYIALHGDASGCLLLLFSANQAKRLLNLLGLTGPEDIFDASALEKSAIAEIGNIIASAYLDALAQLTHLKLLPTPPGVAIGMGGAILDTIAAYLGQFEDTGLLIHVVISAGNEELGLQLLMIPQLDSLQTIFTGLGLSSELSA